MDIGAIITTLIIIGVLVVAIGVGVGVVKYKIRRFSRTVFGTSSLIDGIKGVQDNQEQMRETPRSLHGMTQIYLPMIKKDFPEFDYALYKSKVNSLLRSYFNAIASKKVSAMAEECSITLKNNVQAIIDDFNSRNATQHFDEVNLHQTEIARYIKDGKTVTILFEVAVGYYSYATDDSNGSVVFGSKDLKMQTVYEIGLVYVQDVDKINTQGDALGINCPNCGAPIKNLGNKFCEYCGTGVQEVNIRAWQFSSVAEQTLQKRQF
ncbi:MAG: zinc ribbon domain-containing protein [Ruminococcus sp.]|nr:zinc ribbon domain-containing protein [Ruminococcus sp.]